MSPPIRGHAFPEASVERVAVLASANPAPVAAKPALWEGFRILFNSLG